MYNVRKIQKHRPEPGDPAQISDLPLTGHVTVGYVFIILTFAPFLWNKNDACLMCLQQEWNKSLFLMS